METPKDLKALADELTKSWGQYGALNVGTGYGINGINDKSPPRWMLFAYSRDPKKLSEIVPHEMNGYPVVFRTPVVAYDTK